MQSASGRLAISSQPSWGWPVRARLRHPQDAPDQVLAVAAARLVAADLLVPPPHLACGHRPELPALGFHVEPNSGRGHRASSERGLSATGTVTLDSATRSRIVVGCRGGFRDDSPVAHVVQAPDAACEDVADGADAPRVGGVVVMVGHGRAEGAVPLPLYFRGPEASLPNRGRMFRESGGATAAPNENLAAPPEGDTARSVVAGRGRRRCAK
jgi:hypothetical protein